MNKVVNYLMNEDGERIVASYLPKRDITVFFIEEKTEVLSVYGYMRGEIEMTEDFDIEDIMI